MSEWQLVLLEPAKVIAAEIGKFLMNTLLVVVILLIGWIIARLIRTLVMKVLNILRVNQLSERIELEAILARGGIKYPLSELIGAICYWLVILVTLVVAINAIGLTIAADLLNRIILYIPNIIAAIFILILGMFLASLLSSIIQTAANNAGILESKLISKIVEVLVIIFSIAIALEQLNIGAKIIQLIIGVALASIGLGAALAFGLGCKDIAAKFVAEFLDKIKKK